MGGGLGRSGCSSNGHMSGGPLDQCYIQCLGLYVLTQWQLSSAGVTEAACRSFISVYVCASREGLVSFVLRNKHSCFYLTFY